MVCFATVNAEIVETRIFGLLQQNKNENYDLHIYNIQRDGRWLEYVNDFVDSNINQLHFITNAHVTGKSLNEVLKKYSDQWRILQNKANSTHVRNKMSDESTSDDESYNENEFSIQDYAKCPYEPNIQNKPI